jgi:hypothetical protein
LGKSNRKLCAVLAGSEVTGGDLVRFRNRGSTGQCVVYIGMFHFPFLAAFL